MRKIKKIEQSATHPVKRKRVAAYARVSSGKDAQLHSLSAQISYYNTLIGSRGDWELVGIYADEAMTGTKETRPEFQRLLADCKIHYSSGAQYCDSVRDNQRSKDTRY